MKKITIQDVEFDIPTGYNELSRIQLLVVGRLMADNTGVNQLKCLYSLLGLKIYKWKDRKRLKLIKELPAEWLHTMLSDQTILGWLFNKSSLTNYPISKFQFRGVTYHGPRKNILRLSVIEFVLGFMLYRNYHKTKKTENLNKLVALIYRPYNPFSIFRRWSYGYNGDIRMPLNDYLFERRFKRFEHLSDDIKTAIFIQWSGAWEEFQDSELAKLVFPKLSEKQKKTLKEDPYAWQKIMFSIAESGVFGSLRKVEKMDKDQFILRINDNIEKYMAMQDRIKKK
jgi:hypothetical protein